MWWLKTAEKIAPKIGAVCSVQTPFPHTKRTYVHKIYPSLFPKHPKTRSHNLTKHGLQNPLNNKFSSFSRPLIVVPPTAVEKSPPRGRAKADVRRIKSRSAKTKSSPQTEPGFATTDGSAAMDRWSGFLGIT